MQFLYFFGLVINAKLFVYFNNFKIFHILTVMVKTMHLLHQCERGTS